MLDKVKEYFDTRKCTGLLINSPPDGIINRPTKKIRFCEAIHYSFDIPLLINKENLDCMGAKRSLGFQKNMDNELLLHMSEYTSIPRNDIREILMDTPTIAVSLENIYMGITSKMEQEYKPDFYIVYAHPSKVMEFIHELLSKTGKSVFIEYNSLLSICGNVFVRGYNSDTACVSFGCPESRKYGKVLKDEVIVGFPEKYIHWFIEQDPV